MFTFLLFTDQSGQWYIPGLDAATKPTAHTPSGLIMTSFWSFITAKPFSSIKGDYVRLENAKVEKNGRANEPEEECATRRVLNVCINIVILSAVALACVFIGYNLRPPPDSCSRGSDHGTYEQGRLWSRTLNLVDFMTPPGNVKYPMVYNLTYTRERTDETNAAWDAMFPSESFDVVISWAF